MNMAHRLACMAALGVLMLLGGIPHAAANGEILALTGATVYASPDAAPIPDGVVLMQAGRITAVGIRSAVPVPRDARVVDCTGLFVAAGFQNSHVHFTERKWAEAAAQPAENLAQQLRDMLTRYGFTTVVDTGSNPQDTTALRRRIETGEIPGPRILTAGSPIYPQNAIPFYLRDALPRGKSEIPESACDA